MNTTSAWGDTAHDQSSSASRVSADGAAFLTFTQCVDRPDLYGEPNRFDTMPSQQRLNRADAATRQTFRQLGHAV